MTKERVEDLVPGDLLWVEYGYSLMRAVYYGRGIAVTKFGRFCVNLDDNQDRGRVWIFRREPFFRRLFRYL